MRFIYRNFKVTNNNGKGFWVSLRELNYMLSKGIIMVDINMFEEYQDTEVPELSMLHMYDNYNMIEEMIYSPTEKDKREFQLFYEAGKRVREQLDAEQCGKEFVTGKEWEKL